MVQPDTDPVGSPMPATDDYDLVELVELIWAARVWILFACVLGCVLAFLALDRLPQAYRAHALLAPADELSTRGRRGLEGVSGLAGLAGLAIGGAVSVSEPQRGIEVLQSRSFLIDFVQRRDLSVPLIAAESWDADNAKIRMDSSIYDEEGGVWLLGESANRPPEPTRLETYAAISDALAVATNPDTGFITVSFDHVSPVFAKQVVDWLISDLNETMREAELREAARALEYLEVQISQTSLAELEAALFQLVREQHERMMLAKVRPEFQFEVVDPAVVPEEPAGPHPYLVAVAIVFVTLALSIIAILTVGHLRRIG